ncbi:g8383 [Coccomyxa elongata]
MPATMGCAHDLAWASDVLGLELHRLDQLQSGAVYLLILDAFHANIIPLSKISLGARYEYEFVYNYRLLKSTFERLNIVKFVDRQRLLSSPEPHEHLLSWFHQRYIDVSVRASYDPVKQRQNTQGGDIKSIPVPVKPGKLTTPMADIGGRAIKPSSIPKPSKVPRLELRMATAAKVSSPPKDSKIPSPPGPLKAPSPPKTSSAPKIVSPPKSARVGFRLASLSAAAAPRAGAKTPRLHLARTPRSPTGGPSSARRTSPKTSPTGRTKRGSPPGRRLSISAATPRSAAVDPAKAAKPGGGVVFKVSPNSGVQQRTPRLFPAQLPTPRQLSSAFRTPRGSHGPVSESKAGFSHGAIPRNSLMMPRATGGSGGGLAATTPRLRSPPTARGTENQPARANNRPSQVPKLSWIRKAAQKLSHTANSTRLSQEDAAAVADVQQEPKQPPVDTDTEQECPQPPVDVPSPATNSTATRVISRSITADSSPADKASGATIPPAAISPAMQRLRAMRQQRITSPRTSSTVKRRLEPRPRAAAPDSASSLNSARGARSRPLSARRRNSLAGLDLGAILLSPDKAACLATSSCKIEAADKIAQAAATTVLRAIPELQMALKDIGSSNRDGYLHRGKLRCRRWMVSTMIPRTRELLMHVRQLSQLAVDDPDARARARRCKRLLKELAAAEQSFADVCDQIAKAERFFPVPGIGQLDQAAFKDNPTDGKAGARQLEVSLRAVGQAMMELQELWIELAPHSPWATSAKTTVRHSPVPRLPAAGGSPGADLSDEDDLSDDDACTNADDNMASPPGGSPDLLDKKGKAAAACNTATITVRCDAGSATTKDGSESCKSAWPRSSVSEPLPEEAAALSTPTKPVAAAEAPQASTPHIPSPQGTPPQPNQAADVATPQRDSRPQNASSELRTPVRECPAAGGNALAARADTAKAQPGLEPSDGVPELSPCSTLGSSGGASSATYSGASSATYSGSSRAQQGSRAGSPSTVLTPEAGLRTAKRLLLGTNATDKARRRGVQAELARFFGCSPVGKGPATIRNVRPPPGSAAAATPAPAHATDEEGKVLPVRKVTFPSGHKYVGQIGNGTMNGLGVYAFDSNQARYEGEFVDGAFEGLGAETFPEGLYVGSFRNGQRHGLGVCHYRNGDYYEGQWRGGVRHGMGMQQCTDGSNYVGGYAAGQRRGCGIYSFPNGDRYEGECAADAPHGHGVYRFAASGAVLEGTWAAGAKHGWAVITVGSQQSYGRWEAGTLMSLAPLEPDTALEDGEEVELEDDEAEERDIAAETARTARAAGLRAIRTADEHWRAAGAMQVELQELLQKAQAAARTARQLAKPLLN